MGQTVFLSIDKVAEATEEIKHRALSTDLFCFVLFHVSATMLKTSLPSYDDEIRSVYGVEVPLLKFVTCDREQPRRISVFWGLTATAVSAPFVFAAIPLLATGAVVGGAGIYFGSKMVECGLWLNGYTKNSNGTRWLDSRQQAFEHARRCNDEHEMERITRETLDQFRIRKKEKLPRPLIFVDETGAVIDTNNAIPDSEAFMQAFLVAWKEIDVDPTARIQTVYIMNRPTDVIVE